MVSHIDSLRRGWQKTTVNHEGDTGLSVGMVARVLVTLLLLCSAGPAAALVAGIQRRAVPSLVARPSVRCCAAEGAVVEEAPPSCDFPGCDGRGRALGGLGAIPLFSWWPIKVRPSPRTRRTPAPALARLR